ncbi:TetR/AcrR family transcriptional regulator [Azospirillum brasilense]|uniref:HTH tetR-type domain-containing protein n=1 Tax=Azospirillum brasilense TaxID=192 RepID=A0A235HED4_AZOBR|nr:TetR/AcrR family transcriptional regulator [Azospirillum brasilense]OYD83877.1 hypothetical protein CHT98_13935 [Azospirillum brasilense]
MRKKTEAKREAILNAATQEFTERGYEGASMSAIVARLGGSKQTLYSYFPSKDDLFVEVMVRNISQHAASLQADMIDATDVALSLRGYGERYLKVRLSPEMISLARLVFGESGRSDVSRLLHQRGKMKVTDDIGKFLAAAMKEGRLCEADPTVVALHYMALLDAELFEPIVLRVREPATDDEIAAVVDRAVNVFVRAYGRPEGGRP